MDIIIVKNPQPEKAFNTVLSDAKEKHQQVNENERCNFGELEAVFILAQTAGSNSALAVENSHTQANVSATATIGVTSEALLAEEASMKRARKKMRKKKKEEEMRLMSAFFKRLVKRVINHQEVLQRKGGILCQ
ncbi:hypothetical protein SESBI_44417 [Sesbania bispinosa]|nr:hypothetical protein SESBI_44417 [Sesbania bispinosa]